MKTAQAAGHPVEIAPLAENHRYRLVSIDGGPAEPMEREEFEVRARRAHPTIDLGDPGQVHWADHPGEWPPWHPGEAG
ncbi:hypothetical protein SCATT_p05840 (plasmid) [Streptantibioticus cattleyicolor NRRL 8057 = DSM 46488]|uniref:Uncharacterized protein n=2 Tax=Streptantibioticus cattleyicolor TaxID=29303 RepID=F8JJB3_STREN|nr:hypothetical protein SCATT_p05840 [Streptantibioticus cattleyicolor NRRL 8057 = DSM 46488]CCB72172.1 protein of unknown function [Streptantibioticus cattleyicolor NRRL 8057 = DSM 46488]